ncbi:CBS domain-containing protein [Candidatus Woesearchaeota archaeon]|nr:CBS domain-containing protein [Candidatus Woesearchaeota archaeon]
MKVREAMIDVRTVQADTPVNEIAREMAEKELHSVVVLDKKRPIGLLTEQDLVREIVAENLHSADMQVRDILMTEIVSVDPDDYISEATELMSEHQTSALVVMEHKKILGKITMKSIIQHEEMLAHKSSYTSRITAPIHDLYS